MKEENVIAEELIKFGFKLLKGFSNIYYINLENQALNDAHLIEGIDYYLFVKLSRDNAFMTLEQEEDSIHLLQQPTKSNIEKLYNSLKHESLPELKF